MKRLLFPLIGSGVEGDTWRVDLPTWVMVAFDPARMLAVIDVPEADLPASILNGAPRRAEVQGKLYEVVIFTNAQAPELRKHLASRYA